MNYTINYKNISSFLLITFSGFYLTRILSISPIYFTFIIALTILIIGKIQNNCKTIHHLSIAPIIYFIYLVASQPINEPNISSLINVLFSILYLILALNSIDTLKKDSLLKYSKYFIIFSILILTIEAFWRITHPIFFIEGNNNDYREVEGLLFYAYKYSSIMFQDSNFVGTYCLISYFLYLYLLQANFVKSKIPIVLLGILIILTLSRSAILTVLITHIIIYIIRNNVSLLGRIIILIVIVASFIFLYNKLQSDISFLSKFEIIELAITYLKKASFLNIIFGIGFGNTIEHIGMGSHNLFLTHIIESGVLGFIFFLIINISFIKGSNGNSLYLTIPLFISGMSLTGHAISYYYACLAIIYILNKKNGKDISINTDI